MLTFILFVVVIAAYASLSNRISKLEGRGSPIPTPAPAQPLPAAIVSPAPPVTPPVAQPVAPVGGFNEEVGGRWLGKLGIAAVFIGLAFFLKYAFDTGLIGIVGRIVMGLLLGIAFIIIGRYIKARYENYASLLMGGGIAVLYLTLYAAFNFYHLFSQPVAFAAMVLVTAAVIILSWIDRSLLLAALGIAGGFATPYLIDVDMHASATLFTYLAFLDLTVVIISFREKWQQLVYFAFAGTALEFCFWYGGYYMAHELAPTLFFGTLFFIIFHLVTLLRIERKAVPEEDQEILLVSMNALGYFGLLYAVLNPAHHDILWIVCLGLSAVYYSLAYTAYKSLPDNRHLSATLAGIATIFLTLSVPLKLKGQWITLAWLLEGVLLSAVSVSLKRTWLQVFGACVYALGLIKLLEHYSIVRVVDKGYVPFFNEDFVLFLVAIAAAYLLAYLYYKNPQTVMNSSHTSLANAFLLIANFLSIYILTSEISAIYDKQLLGTSTYNNAYADDVLNQKNTVISIVWTVYSLVLLAIGFVRKSKVFRLFGLGFFFLTAAKVFLDVWSLGQLYRVVSAIIFGAVALAASFAYAKYGKRMKDLILS